MQLGGTPQEGGTGAGDTSGNTHGEGGGSGFTGGAVTVGLLVALAVQNAVPPFATDMYSPAFPQVTESLGTTSSLGGRRSSSGWVRVRCSAGPSPTTADVGLR